MPHYLPVESMRALFSPQERRVEMDAGDCLLLCSVGIIGTGGLIPSEV